jgi:hypothetical protein
VLVEDVLVVVVVVLVVSTGAQAHRSVVVTHSWPGGQMPPPHCVGEVGS